MSSVVPASFSSQFATSWILDSSYLNPSNVKAHHPNTEYDTPAEALHNVKDFFDYTPKRALHSLGKPVRVVARAVAYIVLGPFVSLAGCFYHIAKIGHYSYRWIRSDATHREAIKTLIKQHGNALYYDAFVCTITSSALLILLNPKSISKLLITSTFSTVGIYALFPVRMLPTIAPLETRHSLYKAAMLKNECDLTYQGRLLEESGFDGERPSDTGNFKRIFDEKFFYYLKASQVFYTEIHKMEIPSKDLSTAYTWHLSFKKILTEEPETLPLIPLDLEYWTTFFSKLDKELEFLNREAANIQHLQDNSFPNNSSDPYFLYTTFDNLRNHVSPISSFNFDKNLKEFSEKAKEIIKERYSSSGVSYFSALGPASLPQEYESLSKKIINLSGDKTYTLFGLEKPPKDRSELREAYLETISTVIRVQISRGYSKAEAKADLKKLEKDPTSDEYRNDHYHIQNLAQAYEHLEAEAKAMLKYLELAYAEEFKKHSLQEKQ